MVFILSLFIDPLLLFQESLSLYIYSIRFCSSALLNFHILCPFPEYINILSMSLFHFVCIINNGFICIIVTCVFINLFYSFSCICIFYWGFSQVCTAWCPIKTIPTVHNTIYLWNKTYVSVYYCIACILYLLT